jgi:hypothetical protein
MTFVSLLSAFLIIQGVVGKSLWAAQEDKVPEPIKSTSMPVAFIAIGDMPYSRKEYRMLSAPDGVIYKAIQAIKPELLIHFGDLKSGGSSCTDKNLLASKALIYYLNPERVVYTPGDNDWVDCDRFALPDRFDELERLAFIRQHFYQAKDNKLDGAIKGLVRQNELIENARWRLNDLYFATVHVPGTNNGRDEIVLSDVNLALDEADKRDHYNELWLDELFTLAANAQGVVISFQADIYQTKDSALATPCTIKKRVNCDGYMRIREQIKRQAIAYKKPVLVIHGDTNAYCFQQQAKQQAANLWRLNALGDYKLSDAAKITFDASDPQHAFKVVTLLTGQALPSVCDYRR